LLAFWGVSTTFSATLPLEIPNAGGVAGSVCCSPCIEDLSVWHFGEEASGWLPEWIPASSVLLVKQT